MVVVSMATVISEGIVQDLSKSKMHAPFQPSDFNFQDCIQQKNSHRRTRELICIRIPLQSFL